MKVRPIIYVDNLHDKGNKDGRAGTLQQKVGKRLENGIGNKEDCEGCIVLADRQGNILRKAGNLCISNVCTVEEAYEIQ
jgi:hypothetical protein